MGLSRWSSLAFGWRSGLPLRFRLPLPTAFARRACIQRQSRPCRTIRILFRDRDQTPLHWIPMNVQAKCGIFLPAPDSPVIETFLPYLALKAEFLLCRSEEHT